jgi:short-subunit dehydrogenase
VARRKQRLEELADELRSFRPSLRVDIEAVDLSDLAATEALADRLANDDDPTDVIVNDAGFGDRAFVERADPEKLDRMIAVNVVALTLLTRRLVPGMIERGRGGVLNVGSVLGQSWLPGNAAYAGTKHYVAAFTQALRAELHGTGVVVTEVRPGPVRTEFAVVAGPRAPVTMPSLLVIDAAQCAAEALRGFRRGRAVVYPGFFNRWLMRLHALVPASVYRFVAARMAASTRARLPAGG